jgi:hypothetical protein
MSWCWAAKVSTFTSFGVGVLSIYITPLKRTRKKQRGEGRGDRACGIEVMLVDVMECLHVYIPIYTPEQPDS